MHSWLPILILIGVVALVVGPIMMLRPSNHQQQLIQLRRAATMAGMRLRMDSLNLGTESSSVAVYSVLWQEPIPVMPWCLKRQRFTHGVHFYGEWDWSTDQQCPPSWEKALKSILDELGDDIAGIEASKDGIGIFWQEKGGMQRFNELHNQLQAFRETLYQQPLHTELAS